MMHPDKPFVLVNSAARRLSMIMIACVTVIDLTWLPFSALSFSTINIAVLAMIVGLFLLVGSIQGRHAFSPVTTNLVVEVYILVLFGAVGFVFSYLAIESGWAVRDELFAAIDKALGFDWPKYATYILQNDFLRPASLVFYVISPVLIGFALFWFCLNGNVHRASEIVAMVILGGILCVVISGIVPSVGGAGYFPADSSFYGGHKVVFDDSYKLLFYRFRDGAGMEISMLRPFALIAFPSYHACLSLMVILACRGTGPMGWLIVAINLGSLLSLPVQGGHHLSDVLGGLLVGAVAYWVVGQMSRADGVIPRQG